MKTLEDVLAAWRSDAAVLRRCGHDHDADLIEKFCDDVSDATEDFRTWLGERDAVLASGRTAEWLRKQFPDWERAGLARWAPHARRERQYRSLVLPKRANLAAARADAERAARRDARKPPP